MLLVVPEDAGGFPTLGPQVRGWIEEACVVTNGPLTGEPARFDGEQAWVVDRMYEMWPRDHPRAGQRRYTRCGLSQRRSLGKTQVGGWLGAAELHPDAPVKFGGWDAYGHPVGMPAVSADIVIVSATEQQAADTAYQALYRTVSMSDELSRTLHATQDQIARRDGTGFARALAASYVGLEGRNLTWGWLEEAWKATRPVVHASFNALADTVPKQFWAWLYASSTAPTPGEGSIAEALLDEARAIEQGTSRTTGFFFFHRQATNVPKPAADDSDQEHARVRAELAASVLEATGDDPDALARTNVGLVVDEWFAPKADAERLAATWLNVPTQSSEQVFDVARWDALAVDQPVIPQPGRTIVLSFDGSAVHDKTAILGTDVETGYQWVHAFWDPLTQPSGQVPAHEVLDAFEQAFDLWHVALLYGDPSYWRDLLDSLAGRHGREVVVAFWPSMTRRAAFAIRDYVAAIARGEPMHDGDPRMREHLANARRHPVEVKDPATGRKLFILRKEHDNSPLCKDLADCGWMGWEARSTALKLGHGQDADAGEAWAY